MRQSVFWVGFVCLWGLLTQAVLAQDKALVDTIKEQLLPSRAQGKVDRPSVVMHLTFARNSSVLSPEAVRYLNALGTALTEGSQMRRYRYRMEGHTSSLGNASYNERLSQLRAQAVVDYLVHHFKLQREQFEVVGFGESQPIASNETDAGRQKNRRVVIVNTLHEIELPPPDQLDLDVQVKYLRSGSIDALPPDATLTQRDGYAVEFVPKEGTYVYVCQADSHGQINQLFPNAKFTPETNPLVPGRLYRVPQIGQWFYLDDQKGQEHIVVIAHRSALKEPVIQCQNQLEGWGRGVGGKRYSPQGIGIRPQPDQLSSESLFVWKRSFLHQ